MPEPAWEAGSEFHWDPGALLDTAPGEGGARWLPARHALFATGTGALTALLGLLAPAGRLHVPSYSGLGVAELLAAHVPIAWYRHLPDGRGPRLTTLRAAPGDVVLAQNLFGHDTRAPWDAWARANPGVTVVEDHTHDPLNAWARGSTAAYAVASLRKTLPVPDGAVLWSPRGLELAEPTGEESPAAARKLAAMLLKAAWRAGSGVPRSAFRELQQQGEAGLRGSAAPASALTRAVLPLLDAQRLRSASTRNARALTGALSSALAAPTATVHVLRGAGEAPFRVQLLCADEAVRDALKGHLARHGVFAPVHWPQDRAGFWSGDEAAADLAVRMLTVPVDHRCTADDVHRITDVLCRFGARPVARPARTVAA